MINTQSSHWRVLKFGGSSVTLPAHWHQIGQRVSEGLDAGRCLIIVVSALRGVTDLLAAHATGESRQSPKTLADEIGKRHAELFERAGTVAFAA